MNEGLAQGIEKGIEQGMAKMGLEVAKNLISFGLDKEQISIATQLTDQEIQALR